MGITNADALRNRRAAQRNIRRRCICGRVIAGNAAWWSHTVDAKTGAARTGHRFDGRSS